MKPLMCNRLTLFLFLFSVILYSCNYNHNNNDKELLIYCGITMIRPMTEIKEIIEKQENCSIEITKGGSGNLLVAIEQSGVGDLYLPGSENYITDALKKGLVKDTTTVGYNMLTVMVQKHNPLKISGDIRNLYLKDYYVVIGNPNSGSVGKATKKFLDSQGVFNKVEQNAIRFTTDSKDLSYALINKEADIVINWYATYTWDNNKDYMEILKVPKIEQSKSELILAQLSSSKHPDIAQKFLEYASSKEGKAIFEKYGFR